MTNMDDQFLGVISSSERELWYQPQLQKVTLTLFFKGPTLKFGIPILGSYKNVTCLRIRGVNVKTNLTLLYYEVRSFIRIESSPNTAKLCISSNQIYVNVTRSGKLSTCESSVWRTYYHKLFNKDWFDQTQIRAKLRQQTTLT